MTTAIILIILALFIWFNRDSVWLRWLGAVVVAIAVAIVVLVLIQDHQRGKAYRQLRVEAEAKSKIKEARDAKFEAEAWSCIALSEVDVEYTLTSRPQYPWGHFKFESKVTNRSKRNLTTVWIELILYDNLPGGDSTVIGRRKLGSDVAIPPGEARSFSSSGTYFELKDLPSLRGKLSVVAVLKSVRGIPGFDPSLPYVVEKPTASVADPAPAKTNRFAHLIPAKTNRYAHLTP